MYYIIWLVISGVFFAAGEFLSKKFALHPSAWLVGLIVAVDVISIVAWLPAILQRNQLSIVGTMWSVISLMLTVLIGLVLFKEHVSMLGWVGIGTAVVSVVLLSIG